MFESSKACTTCTGVVRPLVTPHLRHTSTSSPSWCPEGDAHAASYPARSRIRQIGTTPKRFPSSGCDTDKGLCTLVDAILTCGYGSHHEEYLRSQRLRQHHLESGPRREVASTRFALRFPSATCSVWRMPIPPSKPSMTTGRKPTRQRSIPDALPTPKFVPEDTKLVLDSVSSVRMRCSL